MAGVSDPPSLGVVPRRPRLARAAFAAASVVQLAVLYWPRTISPTTGIALDKPVHAAIFGAVVWTGARIGLPLLPLVGLSLLHAVVSELLQHAVLSGRSGDPLDALADAAGVMIAAFALTVRRDDVTDPPDGDAPAPG
jgi:hypothetical protein